MKSLTHIGIIVLTGMLLAGCYDRDIIDFKEFGYTLPKVQKLSYTKQVNAVNLTWEVPTDIAPGFITPLEVHIQKVENGIYREIIIVHGGTSREIAIDARKTYRFIVKLSGYLTDDAREKGKPDKVYSEGQVIEIQ